MGYSYYDAERAYFACEMDVELATLMLLNDTNCNPRVIDSFGDIMFTGEYISTDVFGLGTKMDVVSNDYECYILEWSVKEMNTSDKAKVVKMKKNDESSKDATKEFLIEE